MSKSNDADILLQFNKKLPLLSKGIKDIIVKIYQIQMDMFKKENHDPKRKQLKGLFNNLVESLNNDLFDVNDCISDLQIEILWTDTKLQLEKFKDQFLTTTTPNSSLFNSIFLDFTKCIENAYNIMQTIFKNLTVIFIRLSDLFFHSSLLFRLKQIKSHMYHHDNIHLK
jgi:hypothetical protein